MRNLGFGPHFLPPNVAQVLHGDGVRIRSGRVSRCTTEYQEPTPGIPEPTGVMG